MKEIGRELRDKGVRVPRQLQNSIKSAKWRLLQSDLYTETRLEKWWTLRRLHLDLIDLLRDTQEEAEEEEETKQSKDILGSHD